MNNLLTRQMTSVVVKSKKNVVPNKSASSTSVKNYTRRLRYSTKSYLFFLALAIFLENIKDIVCLYRNSSFVKLKFKEMLRNGLYIIATPIGNLQDISERALSILREVEVVACEDTRITKKLFALLGISLSKRFITYEDHNEDATTQKLIDIINSGQAIALLSDAGSPLISDPGYKLVNRCREQNIYVTAIPGACALITALQLSGLPTNRFMFAGFIPNKDKARQDLFSELSPIDTTLVFYETAPRLLKTLQQAKNFFTERKIAIARELTKMYEETVYGSIAEVIEYFTQNEPKGEFVLMIAPPREIHQYTLDDVRFQLQKRLGETSLKTAVKEICEQYNLNKNETYAFALELKNESSPR